MGSLYDTDVVEWSEQQADLLRRHAAGEKLNERLDWENIIEEVETVGRSELASVECLLIQGFRQDLKAVAWPASPDVPLWQGEARGFFAQARRKYVPSMHQRVDLHGIYADALYALPTANGGVVPLPVPQTCPVTLDELMAGRGSGLQPS